MCFYAAAKDFRFYLIFHMKYGSFDLDKYNIMIKREVVKFFNFFEVGNLKVLDNEIVNYRCVREALLLAMLGNESGGCWGLQTQGQGG